MAQMPEQMPGLLAKLDDPWGINWRLANAVKRFSLSRSIRFVHGFVAGVRYERPVFIVGVPRSGTTMMFHLLRESGELGALPREGHNMWRAYHHPRYSGWRSDRVERGRVRFGERRFVNAYLYSHFVTSRRFVEKTPENSLRIPYLLDLFPDALFVVVKRNPCEVINSIITGWRHPQGRFRSYYVPENLRIPAYPHKRRWCFCLIDGWRDYVASPIHHIAFAQWEQCTKAILAGRSLVPAACWTEVHLEHILASPNESLLHLCTSLEIQNRPSLRKKLSDLLADPVNALSAPQADKWRRTNEREIAELLPKIAPLARETGYLIDPATGKCDIAH
jgi:hypothetical protein